MVALMCGCCCSDLKSRVFNFVARKFLSSPDSCRFRYSYFDVGYMVNFVFDGYFSSVPVPSDVIFNSSLDFSFSSFDDVGFFDLETVLKYYIVDYTSISLIGKKFDLSYFEYVNIPSHLSKKYFLDINAHISSFIPDIKACLSNYASLLRGYPEYPSLPNNSLGFDGFFKSVNDYLVANLKALINFDISYSIEVFYDDENIIRNIEVLSFEIKDL